MSAPPAPRLSVGLWSAALAAGLAVAALRLPWRAFNPTTILLVGLAAAHGVTALLCAAGHARRGTAWLCQSWLSLAVFAVITFQLVASAVILARVYGGLGAGIGGAIGLVLLAVAAPVLPLAVWGVVAQRRARITGAAALILALAAAGWTLREGHALAGEAVPRAGAPFAAVAPRAATSRPVSPVSLAPAVCPLPPGPDAPTAFVTSPAGVECLQARDAAELRVRVAERIARAERPVAVDEVIAVAPLGPLPLGALGGLLVRPARDGVCGGGRCLAPWQLVAVDAFTAHQPVGLIRDLRFGVDHGALAARLGAPPSLRVATTTTVIAPDGAPHALDFARLPPPAFGPAALAAAGAAAERYILAAQDQDGRFFYSYHPFTGERSMHGFGIPRQAGTTLALCELGSASPEVAGAARRSLVLLVREHDGAAGPRFLGQTALVLAALVTCRPRVGPDFDPDIRRLAGMLLALARPDGSFHPQLDVATGTPRPGPEPLYAGGQAVLALVLVEALPDPPPGLHDVVERAMAHSAGYWPSFLRDFFFLEENWHCLAARAALGHHRHDGYERFCLDYVAGKGRFLLGDDVAPAQRGGLGFGNLVPPQSTPTAGHGEALAAAIAVRRARGEDASLERRDLTRVLMFLLRQQWRGLDCFACAEPERAAGAFSESVASPLVRIDYVQHAWAALGHGARELR